MTLKLTSQALTQINQILSSNDPQRYAQAGVVNRKRSPLLITKSVLAAAACIATSGLVLLRSRGVVDSSQISTIRSPINRISALQALLAAAVPLMFSTPVSGQAHNGVGSSIAGRSERLAAGSYLAASTKNAAFPVRTREDNLALLFLDFGSGAPVKLASAGAHLLSPYLSPDGSRLVLVRQLMGRKGYELVTCDTREFRCRKLVETSRAINSPIEITAGRILYVSSPYIVGPDGRGRYSRNDFWVVNEVGESRRLTNIQAYQIRSVSVSNDAVYFAAEGEGFNRRLFPKRNPLAKEDSEIFRMAFKLEEGAIVEPSGLLNPLFPAGGRATSPSVSADGKLISFLRTPAGLVNYRYDWVIVREGKQTTIESVGWGFSQPIVVGEDVLANEILSDRHLIKKATPGDPTAETVAEITDGSIDAMPTIELKFK